MSTEKTVYCPRKSQRRQLLSDAYLTAAGHKRPGMKKGLPLDEALRQAADMEKKIRQLAAPVTMPLRLVPAK